MQQMQQMQTFNRAALSVGAVGASVGLAAAGVAMRKRDADDVDATQAWLDSSWPRWGLPRKVFASVWCLVMYPLMAYLLFSCYGNSTGHFMWAAAIHLISNAMWVPSLMRWEAATLAVASSLLMVFTAAYITLTFSRTLPGRTRAILWVYVAWVAYSASITANYLFSDE